MSVIIRPIEPRDAEHLKGLECGHEWQFGRDFLTGYAIVDAHDQPVMAAGAWSRAEVHMLSSRTWETPGARHAALRLLHDTMERDLRARNVGEVVTFMDGMKALGRRLRRFGWDTAKHTMWARKVG